MTQGLYRYKRVAEAQKEKRCGKRKKTETRTKSYVILCNSEIMIVPIKADLNPYNGRLAYAGGSPQFFGGSSQGNRLHTMQQEVQEESRGTLELQRTSEQPFFSSPPLDNGNELHFYYSISWRHTGINWNNDPQLPAAQREMQRLVEVERRVFTDFLDGRDRSFEDIIGFLENETDTVNAPGFRQFQESHTATAFVRFIRDVWSTL